MSTVIRVLIVDDHRLFADMVAFTLEEQGLEVVGVAVTGKEALARVRSERPDMVLVDLGLPDMSGFQLGKKVLKVHPGVKILALTALDAPAAVWEALHSGFHGYITKNSPVSQFVSSIKAALEGQAVIPQQLARRIAAGRLEPGGDPRILVEQLTAREREVLGLLVEGVNGDGLAGRLSVSPKTVRTHVRNILSKLQVHTRLEAAAFALRHGIVKPPS